LRTCPDGENLTTKMTATTEGATTLYTAEMAITMPRNPYRFKLLSKEGAYYLNAQGISRADSPDAHDFNLLADFHTPEWVSTAVFYEIFPDRFFNGDPANDIPEGAWENRGFKTQRRNWGDPPLPWQESGTLDFYGGDLPGITQKIDYLQELGVNALYLTPIFPARTNHRYDIVDFFSIDPYLGGDDALIALRHALNAVGMRLMLDVTLNHTGWTHPWFQEAQASAESPHYEFFTFNDHPHDYVSWLGIPSLVKWNYRSQKLRSRLYGAGDSVLRHWLREPFGIDGWRLDVANMQGKQGASQLGHEIGREIRAAVKDESPNAYLIGEHFHDGTPHLQGDELDASMNYQGFTFPVRRFLAGGDLGADWGADWNDTDVLDAEHMAEQWRRFMGVIPWVIARMQFNLLGSHDTTRILTVCKGDRRLAALGAILLYTFPGVPCVYYGDEIGMEGANDPFNRATMIWERERWDQDLFALHQKLGHLKATSAALRDGGFQILYAQDGLIAFQRQSPTERLIVVGWRGGSPDAGVHLPLWHADLADGVTLRDVMGGGTYTVMNGEIALGQLSAPTGLILAISGA
ncbi:MAG TPA: glycoside hydrolase family 13 protein, partial [Aggregatilineales bacterium]|nr:glycoside hydrolase family 13 protein [Aggregatilineales bacterium]